LLTDRDEIDFPNPVDAPDDEDFLALSGIDNCGHVLYAQTPVEWPKLTYFGSNWEPETLLAAYARGLFPMPYQLDDDSEAIGWWSPASRAIFMPNEIKISRSLRKSMKNFKVTVDEKFREVVIACGDPKRPQGWINTYVIDAFTRLHELGHAHSVEVSDANGALVGGLYGVEIGGVFAGESMFHVQRDASKVALVHLARIMNQSPGRIIDSQWMTDHLRSLGAQEVSRSMYCQLVARKLSMPTAFGSIKP
jgi:leucyl/phenylalanyl-tRNA--protein transferase